MSLPNLEIYIKKWVDALDEKSICPFAKTVYNKKNYKIVELPLLNSVYDFWEAVAKESESFDGTVDVVIVAMPTNEDILTKTQLLSATDSYNGFYASKKKDIWLLNSFDDYYTIMLIQKLSKLDDASFILEKKEYYKNYHPYRYNKYIKSRNRIRKNLLEK